jgi:hypothetical protein
MVFVENPSEGWTMRLTLESQYLFTKRSIFYFSRRVPDDLRGHYTSNRIVLSLRTMSRKIALVRAATFATKLDDDWLTLRWRNSSNPLGRFLTQDIDLPVQKATSGAPGIVMD